MEYKQSLLKCYHRRHTCSCTLEFFMKVAKCFVTETKTRPIAGYVSNLVIASESERVPHPPREWGCLEGFW